LPHWIATNSRTLSAVFFGDLATEDLAASGFDAAYAPTSLGKQLEDLIDALNGPF